MWMALLCMLGAKIWPSQGLPFQYCWVHDGLQQLIWERYVVSWHYQVFKLPCCKTWDEVLLISSDGIMNLAWLRQVLRPSLTSCGRFSNTFILTEVNLRSPLQKVYLAWAVDICEIKYSDTCIVTILFFFLDLINFYADIWPTANYNYSMNSVVMC